MRFLHAADLHQGRLTWSRPGADGIPTSVASVARCWRKAVDVALEQKVDGVIIAGDIFDRRDPDRLSLVKFERELRRLAMPVLMIAGNHDRGDPHSVLELFGGLDTISVEPEVVDFAGLKVGTLPSLSRKHLAASSVAKKARAVDAELSEALERILAWYAEEHVDVVVGHWTVAGCVTGDSETDVSIIDEPKIKPTALEPFRYSAFGHLHKQQRIPNGLEEGRLLGMYSGSIDRMTFAEANDVKVALEVDVETDFVGVTLHKLPARKFRTCEFLSRDEAAEEQLADVKNAIVRLKIETELFDPEPYVKELYDAGAELVTVVDTSIRETTTRDEGMTEALGPLEALDRYFELRNVEPARRESIRQRAESLIG